MANTFMRVGQLASHMAQQSGENRGKFEGSAGPTNIPDIIAAVRGPPVVRFNGFTLDAGRRIVSRDGRHVHLTRKAFDLLTTLVEQAPRVVSKDELHRRLWPETFVTDATVAGVVKELRRALGNQHGGESLIRTAHGVGFAFTGTIHSSDTDDDPAGGRYWLVSGSRRVRLGEGVNEIGRDPSAAVCLDSPQASRLHARITIANDAVTLEDLGSKNHTLVNDRPITEATKLSDGDAIQIGLAVFVFRVTNSMASTETAAHIAQN
jgi:DNA-binding winged helix-turn-helix (wHTH) protein